MKHRSKQEADAWKELSDSYDSHRKSVHAEMEKRKRALAAWKAKGKERASAEDLDDLDVERRDLPEQLLSHGSLELARGIVLGEASKRNPLSGRLQELEYTVRRFSDRSKRTAHALIDGSGSQLRKRRPPDHSGSRGRS